MAYEKNTWTNGDTITAEKLNHMEDGISEGGSSGGGKIEFFSTDEYGMPLCTLGEFKAILSNGNFPLGRYDDDDRHFFFIVSSTSISPTHVSVDTGNDGSPVIRWEAIDPSDDSSTWQRYD